MARGGRGLVLIAGVIALAVGGVWIGQGLSLIPGSFMTGSRLWLTIGLIVAAVGILLLVVGIRRRGRNR